MNVKTREKPRYFGRDLEAMSLAENYYRWLLDEIRPYLGESIAEVGAGRGNFSRFLLGTGVKHLVAFEPSENMFEDLQKQFQNDFRIETVNDFFDGHHGEKSEFYDAIVYINVLEHIADDVGELAVVKDNLSMHGYLIVLVPALSFLYSPFDKQLGHHRRYHKSELVDKAIAAGFKIVKATYMDFLGIIPWYVAFTRLGLTLSGASVSLYDRLCIPVARFIEQRLKPPIGKNLLLVAEKMS